MKILFVTNLYPAANPVFGIFVKEQVEDITKTIKCEYDVYFINAKEKGNFKYITSLFAIPFKLLKGNYNIIHIHYGLSGLFLLFFKPKAKVFLTLHGGDILKEQGEVVQVYLVKKILKRVDKVFILSKEMENVVQPLKVNYEILPCGVNTAFFKPLNSVKRDENVKLILFPADPSRKIKNYSLFEKVIAYLNSISVFTIKYQSIYKLSREEVRDLMNKADCLLMTSISEGSPQVIKEALSCGLPVVSVPVGDVSFMIEQIPDCYVSKTYEAEELGKLVLKTFGADSNVIRNMFINKNIYDHCSITKRIIENYKMELAK